MTRRLWAGLVTFVPIALATNTLALAATSRANAPLDEARAQTILISAFQPANSSHDAPPEGESSAPDANTVTSPAPSSAPALYTPRDSITLPPILEAYRTLENSARRSSSEIRIAEAQHTQRNAQLYTSWTRWLPRVDLQLSQTQSQDFSFATSGAFSGLPFNFSPQERTLSRWALNASVPLYQRGVHVGVMQAIAEREQSRSQLTLKRGELRSRLHTLLGDLLLASYELASIEGSIEAANKSQQEAELRFRLGSRTKVDVLRARANLATLESKRIAAQEQQSTARGRLLEYSGLDPEAWKQIRIEETFQGEAQLSDAIAEFAKIDPILRSVTPYLDLSASTPTLQSRIVTHSPQYGAALATDEVNQNRAAALMNEAWPQLALQGSLNKQGDSFSQALLPGDRSYSLSLMLTVPIFSFGSTISSYYEKTNSQLASEVQRERDILQLRTSIESSQIRIRSLLKSVEAQELAASQGEELYRLTFKSYQLGKSNFIELLDSQNAWADSKRGLAKARLDLAGSVRLFAHQLGLEPSEQTQP